MLTALAVVRSTDSGSLFFAALFGLLAMWLTNEYLKGWKKRAAAKDHVAEVPRNPAIPDECVGCGSHHDPFKLPVRTHFEGVPAVSQVADRKRYPKEYLFNFCLYCGRPYRRRRHWARICIIVGVLLYIHLALHFGSIAAPWWKPKNVDLFFYVVWFDMIVGFVFLMAGILIPMISPAVHILDTGGETIYFRFKNQVYRDRFAALNGV
jgi:hypothetical protein